MSGNPRRVRVASAMRQLLAEMLDRDVKDPRVRVAGFVSVNHVELNSDMSVAHVYVSFSAVDTVDDRAVQRAMAGLEAAARYLRGPLGRQLELRHTPGLHFIADDSMAFQRRLGDLVRADDAARDASDPNDISADDADNAGDAAPQIEAQESDESSDGE